MTDRIKEQLSAFLDGELPDPESALLLKRLERDDELRGALSRYSLIGAVLRSDGEVPAARQVAARVSAAIAREPFRAATFARLPGREVLLRSLAGVAVAASVAFGAVVLVQQVNAPGAATADAVLARAEAPPVEPVASVVDAGTVVDVTKDVVVDLLDALFTVASLPSSLSTTISAIAAPTNAPPSMRHQKNANGSPTTEAAKPYAESRQGAMG